MFQFIPSESWQQLYPDAFIGLLALAGVTNPPSDPLLDTKKQELEETLRQEYAKLSRAELKAQPILRIYNDYYKRFKKSYHIQLQLESIVFKGKSIPTVAALVEAMFMAELKNQLLTAGHDLDSLKMPVSIQVAQGTETFIQLSGQEQMLKNGDMYISDALVIMSTIVYGPDQRTRITNATERVLFTVYAPPGIAESAVASHLEDLEKHVRLFCPDAETLVNQVIGPAMPPGHSRANAQEG